MILIVNNRRSLVAPYAKPSPSIINTTMQLANEDDEAIAIDEGPQAFFDYIPSRWRLKMFRGM
jgi:hypothetical protein